MAAPERETRPDRTPPHSIEAEISILGAALLSPDAAELLVAQLQPEDFYRPAHRHVASAIRRLRAREESIDAVTVSDELGRQGTLEDVGGIGAVSGLYAEIPAISSAPSYAGIVARTATLRRLLWRSAEIQDLVYTNPEDVGGALLRAKELIGSLEGSTERHSTLDIADIATLLESDLVPEEPTLLERSDGQRLLYSGKMHSFQAEPSSGKSWFSLEACRQAIELGGSAIFIDYEDTSVGVLSRLMALGAEAEAVTRRFRYVQPSQGMGDGEKAVLAGMLDELNPDLVVIDGVANALSRDGFAEDSNSDVVKWIDHFPRWISRHGPSVLLIDHVAKSKEDRGRWARGAGAKLGEMDGAAYQLKVIRPFDRDQAGLVKLVIAKDRPGGIGPLGTTAAHVTIDPHGHGSRVVLTFDPDTSSISSDDPWKPTGIMENVSRLIEEAEIPLSPSGVRSALNSKKEFVSQAIARLVAEGYVHEKGTKTKTLELVKPYRDPKRPPSHEPELELPDPNAWTEHEQPSLDDGYWQSIEDEADSR